MLRHECNRVYIYGSFPQRKKFYSYCIQTFSRMIFKYSFNNKKRKMVQGIFGENILKNIYRNIKIDGFYEWKILRSLAELVQSIEQESLTLLMGLSVSLAVLKQENRSKAVLSFSRRGFYRPNFHPIKLPKRHGKGVLEFFNYTLSSISQYEKVPQSDNQYINYINAIVQRNH